MKPHKHAELIKAWADGATIERLWIDSHHPDRAWWLVDYEPTWDDYLEYRIKPEPKPDVVGMYSIDDAKNVWRTHQTKLNTHLKLTFDGETGELKSAEVLK